jgi:DNA-binding transcriptional regulator YhcF (GntR family)
MKRFSIIAGILTLLLLVSVLVGTSNAVLGQGPGAGYHGKGFCSNLTDEQRQAVQEKIKEMKSQDATREEIHSAVAEMLKGYGIEVPEDCHGPIGFGPGKGGFEANLTEEQREAVQEKKEEMRSQGATREEIHSAVAEMLKGYGIELPEDWRGPDGPGGFGPGPGGFWKDLTKEQKEAVQDKIKEMRSQNASREEIHSAVAEMLKGYGIDVPEDSVGPHGRGGFGPGPGGFWKDLTKEQREAVQNKIKEMRSQNASREEIHIAVAEMLKGYGIEVPKDWRGPIGFGQRHAGWKANLTDEQREAVREKIKEMRSQGATREEIRAAVDEMIQGFGIKSPQDSENASSGTSPAVSNVIIAQSYPNPFNPETEISFTLPENSYVSLTIYNIQGQKVKRLLNGYQPAGPRKVIWDGRDEKGEGVASGIYFYRIEAGPNTVTNRMVLLK